MLALALALVHTPPMIGQITRLHGQAAYDYAEQHGMLLNKYEDPTEEALTGISLADAQEILVEDDNLIWLDIITPRQA